MGMGNCLYASTEQPWSIPQRLALSGFLLTGTVCCEGSRVVEVLTQVVRKVVATQPQVICELNEASECAYSLLIRYLLGGRAFGPPLCRGCAPATPPSKTIAHRPCLRIPAVPPRQPVCRQTNAHSDRLGGGNGKGQVMTGTVSVLVATAFQKSPEGPSTQPLTLRKSGPFG